jgi:hypothetical protein
MSVIVNEEERREMTTTAELFDEIAKTVVRYCDAPEVVIRVEMEFAGHRLGVSVVRHIRNPNDVFDNSGDTTLALPKGQMTVIRAKAQDYFDISRGWEGRQLRTTLSVYKDGQWSVGLTSENK